MQRQQNTLKRFHIFYLFSLLLFSSLMGSLAHADITSGQTWLMNQQDEDGCIQSSALATSTQATSQALQTLAQIDPYNLTPQTAALQCLEATTPETTEYLSRVLLARHTLNQETSSLLTELLTYQNEDGGFGEIPGNLSAIPATAFSLLSLHLEPDNLKTAFAVQFLKNRQHDDGGWSIGNNDSSIALTALVLSALDGLSDTYISTDAINKAQLFLLAKQDPTTFLWGDDHISAMALLALIRTLDDQSVLVDAVAAFQVKQLISGSWENDPYTTALGLGLLNLAGPDLKATETGLLFSPTMPQVDQEILISVTVHNSGLKTSEPCLIRFYNGDPATDGMQLGDDHSIGALAPGESITLTTSASFPTTGSRTIFTLIDPDDLVRETAEDNNIITGQLWVATGPDLATFPGDLHPSTYTPQPDIPFLMEYTLHNLGESESEGFSLAVYDGDPRQNGILLTDTAFSGLPGISSRNETAAITLSTTGSHTLYLQLDTGNQVVEISEDNNITSVTVNLGGTPSMADLELLDLNISPDRPMAGEEVVVSALVRNSNGENSLTTMVEIFAGDPDNGGMAISSQEISLSPNTEQTIQTSWQATNGITEIIAIVDRANTVSEWDEENNRLSQLIMADMLDLVISATDISFIPSHPVNGEDVVVQVTVHNQGIIDSPAFSTALYDGDPQNGGTLLATFPLAGLATDTQHSFTYTFTAEARLYSFNALVDQDNIVVEFSETNNQAMRSLAIKAEGETYGPELTPVAIDITSVSTDTQTLEVTGEVKITLQNKGDEIISESFTTLIYEDINLDGRYTQGLDTDLGELEITEIVRPNGVLSVTIPITGQLRFRGAPLTAFVDSQDTIFEQLEDNNLLSSGGDCEVRPEQPIEPIVEWSWKVPWRVSSYSSPVVANLTDDNNDGQINGDDIPDIIIAAADDYSIYVQHQSTIKAFDGGTGQELFSYYDPDLPASLSTRLATADLDNDGLPEIVFVTRSATLYGTILVAINNDGTFKWHNGDHIALFNENARATSTNQVALNEYTIPVIADLENDGVPEIIIDYKIFNADGTVRCQQQDSTGNVLGGALIADLDLDGDLEVVMGNVAYDANCQTVWINKSVDRIFSRSDIGNLDDDIYPEIVYYPMHQVDGSGGAPLYVGEHDGTLKWGPILVDEIDGIDNGPFQHIPLISDFDGDGRNDIGVGHSSDYYIFSGEGSLKNIIKTKARKIITTPTVFDLDGDNKPEILFAVGSYADYFQIFDGKSGDIKYEEQLTGGVQVSQTQTCIVADVDNDKQAEIIILGVDTASGDGLRVYGSGSGDWVNARGVWNQANYQVTNINDDNSIPKDEAPFWLLGHNTRCQAPIGDIVNPYLVPNLTASFLRVTASATGVELTVRIGNGGANMAPALVPVTFYQDVAGSPIEIATITTSRSLAPGEYQDVTYSWVDAPAEFGLVTATVDPANIIGECDLTDNSLAYSPTVVQGLPDLAIATGDFLTSAAAPVEGDLLQLTAHITNRGAAQAPVTPIKLYLGDPASGGVLLSETMLPQTLAPGAGLDLSLVFDSLGYPGINVLYLVIDPDQELVEEYDTNNQASLLVDITTPQLANLTVASFTMSGDQLSQGDETSATVTITNRGLAADTIAVSFYLDDPGTGATPMASQTIYPVLGHGESTTLSQIIATGDLTGDYTLYVLVDPDNTIIESSETDNQASAPLFVNSAALTSSLAINKTSFQAGDEAIVTMTVADSSGLARVLDMELAIFTASGLQVHSFASQAIDLAPNSQQTITTSWPVASIFAGSYQITAVVREAGNVISSRVISFAIEPDLAVTSRVTTDKQEYLPGDRVNLSCTATSASSNYIFRSPVATLAISEPDGSLVLTESKTLTDLMPGAAHTFQTSWPAVTAQPGSYQVALTITETANELATSTATFTILGTSHTGQGLAGTIRAEIDPVYMGQEEPLTYSLTNNGNEDLSDFSLKLMVIDPVADQLMAEISTSVSLIQGQSIMATELLSTATIPPGSYQVALVGQSAEMTSPIGLAATSLEVLPGFTANAATTSPAQLLVWINDGCEATSDTTRKCLPLNGFGHHNKPCIPVEGLKALLQANGYNYHLTYSQEDFSLELRSPLYTDVIILGSHERLKGGAALELEEKVHTGTGLIAMGFHDHDWQETFRGIHARGSSKPGAAWGHAVLGIHSKGQLPSHYDGLHTVVTAISTESSNSLDSWAEKISPRENAVVAGYYTATPKGKGRQSWPELPAIVLNDYGQGKVVYFAFDILSDLPSLTSQTELLIQAIAHIHQVDNIDSLPIHLKGKTIEITGLTDGVEAVIRRSFSADTPAFVDGHVLYDSPWQSNITLQKDETVDFTSMFMAPDLIGSFQAIIEAGIDGEQGFILLYGFELDITVTTSRAVLIDQAFTELDQLEVPRFDRGHIRKALLALERYQGRQITNRADLELSLTDLHQVLRAIAAMDCSTDALRQTLDGLLAIDQHRYYLELY